MYVFVIFGFFIPSTVLTMESPSPFGVFVKPTFKAMKSKKDPCIIESVNVQIQLLCPICFIVVQDNAMLGRHIIFHSLEARPSSSVPVQPKVPSRPHTEKHKMTESPIVRSKSATTRKDDNSHEVSKPIPRRSPRRVSPTRSSVLKRLRSHSKSSPESRPKIPKTSKPVTNLSPPPQARSKVPKTSKSLTKLGPPPEPRSKNKKTPKSVTKLCPPPELRSEIPKTSEPVTQLGSPQSEVKIPGKPLIAPLSSILKRLSSNCTRIFSHQAIIPSLAKNGASVSKVAILSSVLSQFQKPKREPLVNEYTVKGEGLDNKSESDDDIMIVEEVHHPRTSFTPKSPNSNQNEEGFLKISNVRTLLSPLKMAYSPKGASEYARPALSPSICLTAEPCDDKKLTILTHDKLQSSVMHPPLAPVEEENDIAIKVKDEHGLGASVRLDSSITRTAATLPTPQSIVSTPTTILDKEKQQNDTIPKKSELKATPILSKLLFGNTEKSLLTNSNSRLIEEIIISPIKSENEVLSPSKKNLKPTCGFCATTTNSVGFPAMNLLDDSDTDWSMKLDNECETRVDINGKNFVIDHTSEILEVVVEDSPKLSPTPEKRISLENTPIKSESLQPSCCFCGLSMISLNELWDHTDTCTQKVMAHILEPYYTYHAEPTPKALCKVCFGDFSYINFNHFINHVSKCAEEKGIEIKDANVDVKFFNSIKDNEFEDYDLRASDQLEIQGFGLGLQSIADNY